MNPRAIVIAFDGALAGTMPLRREALRAALAEFSLAPANDDANDDATIACGESFGDAVRARHARDTSPSTPHGTPRDETLLDLCVLSADRRYLALVADGVAFSPALVSTIRTHVASGRRVVLRADSPRRLVERALRAHGIDDLFAFARCGDDATVIPAPTALERAWGAIDARLTALAIGREARLAWEPAAAHHVAARFCAELRAPISGDAAAGSGSGTGPGSEQLF